MGTVQIITVLAALFFLLQVIILTARNRLHDKHAFIWLLFAIGGVIIALALPSINKLAINMGISYMPALIFMVAFLIVLSFLVYHTMVLSDRQTKEKKLIQELGLLSKEMRELKVDLKKEEGTHS